MSEIKPTPGGQTIMENSRELAPLTASDIQLIKSKFKKKRKIVYSCMAIFFIAGILVSAYAIYGYGFSRFENYVPFIIGLVAVLICLAVLVMFNQEINLELKNNQKVIYRGVVTKRSEKATRLGTGNNRDTYYDYYIYLGDEIRFEHKDLFFEINESDTIDIQISEKLKYVLYKQIVKKKQLTDVMPEVIAEHGIFQEIREKHQVRERTELLSDEELSALKAQKQRRLIRILPVAIFFLLVLGASAEIILWSDDNYWWDEILAIRIGFWGSPLLFFGLLLLRKLSGLSKDIKCGEKKIFSEKVINKEEYTWASTRQTSYYIIGLTGKIEVSKAFSDSLGAGDDFELHKTRVRNKLLLASKPTSVVKYLNPEIFKFE